MGSRPRLGRMEQVFHLVHFDPVLTALIRLRAVETVYDDFSPHHQRCYEECYRRCYENRVAVLPPVLHRCYRRCYEECYLSAL